MIDDWDQYFMTLSYAIAMKSKDKSITVGCVIVGSDNEILSTGYNSFVRNWDDNDIKNLERPYKYAITEHSERNAIYNAARTGTALKGSRIYLAWHPCSDCARALVQSGISEVIIHKEYPGNGVTQKWLDDRDIANKILTDGGVKLREWAPHGGPGRHRPA